MDLTKEQLQDIVSEWDHLINRSYDERFCWESDIGNMFTPLSFAAEVAKYSDNLIEGLKNDAEEAAAHLFNEFPENMEGREFDRVVEDILRNIARDAKYELEDLED